MLTVLSVAYPFAPVTADPAGGAEQVLAQIDRALAHDLPGHACDQRGFTLVAPLVARAEPVPALLGVGGTRLRRVEDEEAILFGEDVHARAGGEVVGRLGASV